MYKRRYKTKKKRESKCVTQIGTEEQGEHESTLDRVLTLLIICLFPFSHLHLCLLFDSHDTL